MQYPLLIHPGMENIIRNVTTNPEGTIMQRTGQCRLQADDVVVMGHAVKHLAETTENVTSGA
jgi:hypothetical protein